MLVEMLFYHATSGSLTALTFRLLRFYEIKNPIFEYRTSLIMKELKDGNISLRISNVKMSDAGKYKCLKLWKKAPREVTEVELVFGTSSQVHLITKARNAAQALDLV